MADQQRTGERPGSLSPIEAEYVPRQLQKILASASFVRAARMKQFLTFIVEHRLSANDSSSSNLKEVVIGVSVFDRSPEYDPKLDPIVRVEARRLRAKLFEYYQGAGQSDSLVIELPTGGYTPTWRWRSVEEPIAASPPPDVPVGWRRSITLGTFALALVLAVLIGWWSLSHGQSEAGIPGMQLPPTPLTSYPGREYTPSFSPDGNAIAYTWDGPSQDNFDIYIEVIGSQKPLRLTSHPDAELSPRWSRDGRSIAFIRAHADGTSEVMTVAATGGSPSRVCTNEIYYRPNTRPLEWSSDSNYLFMSGLNGFRGLVRIDVLSGSALRITDPPPGQVDLTPALSPDGSTLAFVHDVGHGVTALTTLKLDRNYAPVSPPQPLQVAPCAKSLCINPEWSADGKFLLFVSNHQGGMRLWSVRKNGENAQLLSSMGDQVLVPAVARSGRRMAFARDLTDTGIWRLDLTALNRATPIGESTRLDQRPRVSPDGSMLAFESDRTGFTEIWVASSDGSDARPLTNFKQEGCGSPSWSPDGSRLVFDSHHEGQSEIYEISIKEGAPRRLTNHENADILPEYSPDREWIYFTSSRSGQFEVWRMPVHGGPPVQVTRNGGFGSRLSADGHVLYYTKQEDLRPLWSCPSSGGPGKRVCDSVLGRSYEIVKTGIYFISADKLNRFTLQFLDSQTGAQRHVYTFDRSVLPGLSVSGDGRFAYYTQVDRSGSDLMLADIR